MDQFTSAFPVWVAGLLSAWLVMGAGLYFCMVRFVARENGARVSTIGFQDPDTWVCLAFVTWFILNIANGFGAPDHDVTRKEIIAGAGVYLGIVTGLGLFMAFRGINPLRQFGILRRNAFLCLAMAAGLLAGALPLVLLTESLTALALNGKAQPQSVVEYFINASEKSDSKGVALMLVLAVLVAPAAEETIFRGYLYGVIKRHVGGLWAALFTAALFAALHLNLAALPALFVLSLCLTLAYEATGSLLVNIFMHGLFNLTMLLVMLYITGHSAAS